MSQQEIEKEKGLRERRGDLEPIVINLNKDVEEMRSHKSKKTNKTSKSKKKEREQEKRRQEEAAEKSKKIEYYKDQMKTYDLLHAILLITGTIFGFL